MAKSFNYSIGCLTEADLIVTKWTTSIPRIKPTPGELNRVRELIRGAKAQLEALKLGVEVEKKPPAPSVRRYRERDSVLVNTGGKLWRPAMILSRMGGKRGTQDVYVVQFMGLSDPDYLRQLDVPADKIKPA